jgi:hypothetical protein
MTRRLCLFLLFLALTACASLAPPPALPTLLATPTLKPPTRTRLPPTKTPTATITLTVPTAAITRGITRTPAPGLILQGRVTHEGDGLKGVKIYRSYASYGGELVAATDADGYYQSEYMFIPGDEMVTVWAELDGYVFEPEREYWRHYYGLEQRTLDFTALVVTPTP